MRVLRGKVTALLIGAVDGVERYTGDANGTPYGVVLVPIRNFAGDPMGVVAAARDFSASRAAAGQSRVIQALLATFAVVLLAGVILVVVRGLLLDPLAELRRLRASGTTAPTRDETDTAA